MKKKGWWTVLIIVLFFFIYFYFSNSSTVIVKECVTDTDCVPDSCCHASSCVSIEKGPSCVNFVCTGVCEPETLDCGQSSCSCVNNKCEVKKR